MAGGGDDEVFFEMGSEGAENWMGVAVGNQQQNQLQAALDRIMNGPDTGTVASMTESDPGVESEKALF